MAGDIHISDPTMVVEVVEEIERRFGVRLNPHRVAVCRTVGDLYAHLLEVLGPDGQGPVWVGSAGEGPQDTPTLMALWRLRAALRRLYPGADVRADALLDRLGMEDRARGHGGPDPRRPETLRRIEEESGLKLPDARLHPIWTGGMAVPGLLVAWWFGTAPWIIVGLLLALLGSVFSDLIAERLFAQRFARLPRRYRTVEDLARAATLLNIGALRRDGGRIPERFLWAAYADCIRTVMRVEGTVEPGQPLPAR